MLVYFNVILKRCSFMTEFHKHFILSAQSPMCSKFEKYQAKNSTHVIDAIIDYS